MDYSINTDTSLLKERAIEQWVLRWCREHHPEAFEEASQYVEELFKEKEGHENKQKS